jgi:hypothetical protein
MPSAKPFVIAYISKDSAAALQDEAELLSDLATFYRSEGFGQAFGVPTGRVQPGQVAAAQIQHGMACWPAALQKDLPHTLRPVRQRWLLEAALHSALTRRAKACNRSLSDLVARMVQPLPPTHARRFDVENAGLRFVPPAWAHAVAKERLRELRQAKRAEQRKRLRDPAGSPYRLLAAAKKRGNLVVRPRFSSRAAKRCAGRPAPWPP